MDILALVLQVLLALAFLLSGGRKLAGSKTSAEMRDRLHVAPWFWTVTAVIELVAAVGLLVGIWGHSLAFLAALALAATMAGAAFTQIINKQSFQQVLPAAVLFVLALVVVLARWPDVTHLFG